MLDSIFGFIDWLAMRLDSIFGFIDWLAMRQSRKEMQVEIDILRVEARKLCNQRVAAEQERDLAIKERDAARLDMQVIATLVEEMLRKQNKALEEMLRKQMSGVG